MTRTLVAGGTGSLGTALVDHLVRAGHDVVVMTEPDVLINDTLAALDLDLRVADVRDRARVTRALRGVDRVYNLAGVAIPLNRLHDAMTVVNVHGARTMALSCAEAGVQRLVHVSSISAVGYPPAGESADERFDVRRSVCTNSYALTKRAGEDAVLGVADSTGLDVSVLVPAAVVAPWSHRRTGWAALVDLAMRGRLVAYPPGAVSLCSLSAFRDGATAVMERGKRSERYVVTTETLSYAALFGLINDVVGRPAPRFALSGRTLRVLARMARAVTIPSRRSLLVAEESVDLMIAHLSYDATRARTELGVDPGSVRESVQAVHTWLLGGAR